MSLGSEFNVHPILQLVPHDTENTALIMSWLDTVTVSEKRKKKVWLGFLVMNLGTYPESSAEKVVEQEFFKVGKIYYMILK